MPTAKVSVVVLATASAEPKVRSSRIKRARFEVGTEYSLTCEIFVGRFLLRYKVGFASTVVRKRGCNDLVVADIHV